jgi:PAS domain S-box-containing protein
MFGSNPIPAANSNLASRTARLLVFFLVLLTRVLPQPAFAQAVDLPVHFDHVSLDQGLSSPEVWSVLRDNRGFVGFSILDGLNRFDGYQTKVFQHDNNDPGSLSENTFRVLGSNNDEIWNKDGVSIHMNITPPWWETAWFRVTAALLLVGLVAGSFIWQRRRAARQQQKLEALVVERTRELQDARTQIGILFNSSPMGIALSTVEGNILEVNRAMQRITGYSEDELLHTNVKQLYADPEQRARVVEQLAASGNLQNHGIQLRRRDGSLYYASLNLSRLDMSGQEVLLAIIDDVSDQIEIREALSTLHDISNDLSTIADLPTLLNHALQRLNTVVDFQQAALMLVEDGEESVTIHPYLSPALPPEPKIRRVPFSRVSSLQTVWERREVVYVPDIQTNETIQVDRVNVEMEWWAGILKTARSLVSLPLVAGERKIGLLNILHDEANHYDIGEIELARTFANQLAIAIDNIRLNEQARLAAAANERSRIARELHDSVTQTLFTASVLAQATPRLWDRDQGIARQNMEKLNVLIRGALAEMRSLLLELRSGELQNQTLGQLLGTLAEAGRVRTRAAISISIKGDRTMPDHVTLAFYRIAQEALNNTINHAEATQINMSLLEEPDRVELRIQDDGRGFDPRDIPAGHMGVSIMLERATQIGADLQIHSRPSQATEIVVTWSNKGGSAEHD